MKKKIMFAPIDNYLKLHICHKYKSSLDIKFFIKNNKFEATTSDQELKDYLNSHSMYFENICPKCEKLCFDFNNYIFEPLKIQKEKIMFI